LVAGIALHKGMKRQESESLGLAVATALLKRRVLPYEFEGWMASMEARLVPHDESSSGSPRTVREWLIRRFVRMYSSMRNSFDWKGVCSEAVTNPTFVLAAAGDLRVARLLYELDWKRPSKTAR